MTDEMIIMMEQTNIFQEASIYQSPIDVENLNHILADFN